MAKLQEESEGNWKGKLYDFKKNETQGSKVTEMINYGVKTTGYREPAIVTESSLYDAVSSNLNKIQEGLTKEALKVTSSMI